MSMQGISRRNPYTSMANGEHGHLLLCRQRIIILLDHYSDYWEIDQLSDLSADMLQSPVCALWSA